MCCARISDSTSPRVAQIQKAQREACLEARLRPSLPSVRLWTTNVRSLPPPADSVKEPNATDDCGTAGEGKYEAESLAEGLQLT